MSSLSESQKKLLEQRLRGRAKSVAREPATTPRRASGEPSLASLGQQGIFAAHQTDPDSPAFNITSSFEVHGTLDIELLERAVAEVVHRHEVLRSRYRMADAGVEMAILDEVSIPITVRRCDDGELLGEAQALVQRPFDVEAGPLLRLHYLEPTRGRSWLILVVHDIVFDKWSLGVFWSEVAALYRQARAGDVVGLAPLALTFREWAEEQRRALLPAGFDEQIDYWRRVLADPPRPLELPTDRPYPASLTDAGTLARGRLSPAVTRRLKELAALENVSLFTALILCFELLLQRYTDADDIVVASPIANRRSHDTAGLIGFFLSTVPFRWRAGHGAGKGTPTPSFRRALDQMRDVVLGAIEHQDPPFDRIVDAVRPERVPGRHPLCQTMFVFQRQHEGAPEFDLGDVALKHIYVDTGTSKYDLTLFAAESGAGIETTLEYRTDLFDSATAERMLAHYEQLVASLVEDPDRRVSAAEILGSTERRQLLDVWQGAQAPIEGPGVLRQIEHSAKSAPNAAALIGSDGVWSYSDLDRTASSVAARLRAVGIGRGARVAHLMHRTPASIAGLLGVLRAGAAYVPLDPTYPQDRRAQVIADAAIEVAVVSPGLDRQLGSEAVAALVVDDRPTGDGATLSIAVEPGDVAYTIYTSGSTGQPKGVVVTHGNLDHSTAARRLFYGDPPRRFLLIPSLSFDSSVAGLFWTLASGGTLVLADLDAQRDPQRLAEIIDEHRVTDLLSIPTLYREILAVAASGAARLDSLSRAIVAGESCPARVVALHHQSLPGADLFNEYGPTEATVWASVHRCSPHDDTEPVPIGRPIANTRIHLLDGERRLAPTGVAGEIHIAGGGVAAGYWNRDDLTRERFFELDTSTTGLPERVYATGDLGRWRADGRLEFLGRCDDQVKIRGYRIELGEIESALVAQTGIADAVAAIRVGDGSGASRLIGYVVPARGAAQPDVDALRRSLADSLPAYAVPHILIALDVLPRLPNGKVDRGALPEPTMPARHDLAAPAGEGERRLATVWQAVLGLEQISIHDDFFALGGDSLTAIQVVSRARLAGMRLRPRDLADHPTIAALAELAEQRAEEEAGAVIEDLSGPIPLTPIQLWFFSRQLAVPEHWNLATSIEVAPDIDDDAIQAAVAALVAHHPQLRAGFREVDGAWIQEVRPDAPAVEALAAEDLPPGGAVERIQREIRLDGSALARFAVVGAGASRSLVAVAHHLVIDAVSWQILLDDLEIALDAATAGRPIELPETGTPFALWARALDELASDPAEADYWCAPTELEPDTEIGRLPVDRPVDRHTDWHTDGPTDTTVERPADPRPVEADAETLSIELDRKTSGKLFHEALEPYHSRIDDLLVAALVRSLASWTEPGPDTTTRLRIGLERHGRDAIEALDLSRTIGWFTSAFPIRVEHRVGTDLATTIKAVKETLRGVPRSGIGYGRLRYAADPTLGSSVGTDEGSEDVLFNYLGRRPRPVADRTADASLLSVTPLFDGTRAPANARSHALEINAYRDDDTLVMRWTFNAAAHDRSTIARWADQYLSELEAIVEHCLASDGGFTPSDFPDAGMSQEQLDSFLDSL